MLQGTRSYSYQFTVRETVLMGRAMFVPKFAVPCKQDRVIVEDVLHQLKIEHYADHYYCELSGGEQQIVLFARAIAQETRFILLDEPASNLDFANQKKLLKIIRNLTDSGRGILMVSHAPEHALSSCSKSLLIDKAGKNMYGDTVKIVNSENLSHIYGVQIGVADVGMDGSEDRKTCYLV